MKSKNPFQLKSLSSESWMLGLLILSDLFLAIISINGNCILRNTFFIITASYVVCMSVVKTIENNHYKDVEKMVRKIKHAQDKGYLFLYGEELAISPGGLQAYSYETANSLDIKFNHKDKLVMVTEKPINKK